MRRNHACPDFPPVSVDARRYVWHKQALFKGRSPLYGTTWAGWGFWEWMLESLPVETRCTLTIGDLRLLLDSAQSWSLHLSPGTEYPFTVRGFGNPLVKLAAAEPDAGPRPAGGAALLQGGGSSGAFLLDDPSGFFSDGAAPDGQGSMGFATIDLEAGIAPRWGDVCLHGGQTLMIDLAAAVSPAFARDRIHWDTGDGFVKVRQDKSSAEFSLVENHGSISASISPPASVFGYSGPDYVHAHRHLGGYHTCGACGYVHKVVEGSETGCFHDKDCGALDDIEADCSCAPSFIRVNSDDDNLDGAEDRRRTAVAEGEDDFRIFGIPEPKECYDYCQCSNENTIYWKVVSVSAGLRLRVDGEIAGSGAKLYSTNSLAIEALSASASLGSDWIEFEIRDESKEPDGEVLRRITRRFTAANAQIKPDRDGDGVVGVADARLAAGEPAVWRVARREDPYLLALQNECPGDMTPRVYLENGVPHPALRIGTATIVPGGSADTERDTTLTAWLDASGPAAAADLEYGIVTPENLLLCSDELTIEVVDVDLGERWIAAGGSAQYSFGSWAADAEWYVLKNGWEPVEFGWGADFATSPSLPAGDYVVNSYWGEGPVTGASMSEGGVLHVVDVDIEKDAYGAQCGSDDRVKVALDTATSTGPADWRIEPSVADGARLYATATGGTGFQTLSGLAEVWVSPGTIPQDYTITATHPFVANASDTATFAALSLDIFGDLDFDGDVDADDNALQKDLTAEFGWTMPVNANFFRVAQLQTDVSLPGTFTLRLDGDPAFKVWQSPNPATNDAPLLVAGQVVTNGVDGVSWNTGSIDHVYLQSIAPGTARLTYTFIGTGEAEGIASRASLKITAVEVVLEELSFINNHTIVSDDSSTHCEAPHWLDPDRNGDTSDGHSHPLCFTRNTRMKVSGKWHLQPTGMVVPLKIRGDGPGDLDFPPTTAIISGEEAAVAGVLCENAFADEIDFIDPMRIIWQFSLDDGMTWNHAGASSNQTYVTLGDPSADITLFHSIVDVGCRNGDGKRYVDDAVASIWSDFTDLIVRRVDGTTLHYYSNSIPTSSSVNVPGLLATADGQCTAWSGFFAGALLAQGIDAEISELWIPNLSFWNSNDKEEPVVKKLFYWSENSGMLVKHWSFSTPNWSAFDANHNTRADDDEIMYPDLCIYPIPEPTELTVTAYLCPYSETLPIGSFDGQTMSTTGTGLKGQGNIVPSIQMFNTHYVVTRGLHGYNPIFFPPQQSYTIYDPSYGAKYEGADALKQWTDCSVDGFFISWEDEGGLNKIIEAAPNDSNTVIKVSLDSWPIQTWF